MLELLVFSVLVAGSVGLENGLARTPPMGWMSWERFRCNTDCTTYPEDCIRCVYRGEEGILGQLPGGKVIAGEYKKNRVL